MLSAEDLFDKAEVFYKNGNKQEAINYYLQALQENPNHIDTLINLSVTLIEVNRKDEALIYIKKALDLERNNYIVLVNYANILFLLNKIDEALNFYLSALKINPHSSGIKKNIAYVMMSQGKYESAIIYLKQLISDGITDKDVFLNLVSCFNNLKRYEEALNTILLCNRIYPKDCDVINSLAITFEYLGNMDMAENCYRQIVRLQPQNHLYNFNLGLILKKRGLFEEALRYFNKAVQIKNDFHEGILELANTLKTLKRYQEALETYKILYKFVPHSPVVLNNIGTTYYEIRQYDTALKYLNDAIKENPEFANAYFNRGLVFKEIFEYEKAINDYLQALKINDDYPEAHWNLGLLLLLKGDFLNGFRHYEWRKRLTVYEPFKRDFKQPEWHNEDLKNKTILLYDEQGFGDAIQFIRYARLLKDKGGRVIIQCLEPLTRLFMYADGVDDVITRGYPLPEFDYHCSLLTLPLRFNTTIDTIPNSIPYIKIRNDIQDKDMSFKIGIAWAGINPLHKSCPVDIFLEIFSGIDDVKIFNLQKIITDKEKEVIKSRYVIDKMDEVKDFLDTAVIMCGLDLIISIDTSIVHLAGAMGLNVWTLLHYDADWRWLLNREDTPWYPTMRLFRQESYGDWKGLIKKVNQCLLAMI